MQFNNLDDQDVVLEGLLGLGFDSVFEVARAAEPVSYTHLDVYKRQVIVSGGMALFIGAFHPLLGALALLGYVTVGVAVPLLASRCSGDTGSVLRARAGDLSGYVLDLSLIHI